MSDSQLPRLAVLMTPELHEQIDRLALNNGFTFNRSAVGQLQTALTLLGRGRFSIDGVRQGARVGAGKRTRKVDLRIDPRVRDSVFATADQHGMTRSAFVYGVLQFLTSELLGSHAEQSKAAG